MKTNKHNNKESIIIKEFIPGPFVFRLRSIDSCHAASTSQLPQTKVKKKYYNLLIFSLTWVPFRTIQRNEKNYRLKQNEIKSEILVVGVEYGNMEQVFFAEKHAWSTSSMFRRLFLQAFVVVGMLQIGE